MSYKLSFLPSARREWSKLGATLQVQFQKKLIERLIHPRVPGDALHGMADHYKIKLRQAGYRLVYRVKDDVLVIVVVAIGKREHGAVYDSAKNRRP